MPPHIVILATGGTIAGKAADTAHSLHYDAGIVKIDDLLESVPGLAAVATISTEQIANTGSENMTDEIWLTLAAAANRYMADPNVDGIVVLHGTDTLEETAYFLNLTVRSYKPVVMTGAMRPSNALSADGPANILNAVQVAAAPESAGKGVLVCLNNSIAPAREVSKTNTADLATFRTPVFGDLGLVLNGAVSYYREPVRLHSVDSEFRIENCTALPRVEIIYGHAGQRHELVNAAVAAGAKGIVLAATGMGRIHNAVLPALQQAAQQGVVIVCASRTGSGLVLPGGKQAEHGFVTADTLNPHKARVLLQLALTRTSDPADVQRMFNTY